MRNSALARRLQAFRVSSATHHQALRYVLNGGFISLVNFGIGLILEGVFGVPIQIAIPIGYVLSTLLNYTLQRKFVFANRQTFALSAPAQFSRYVWLGASQYAFTAFVTAVLPEPLGVSEQVVYVGAVLVGAAVTFAIMRLAVFHGD